MPRNWLRAAAIGGALFVSACSNSAEFDIATTTTAAPASTTTESTIAPAYATPDVVDVGYVNNVLSKLAEVRTAVTHDVANTKSVSALSEQRVNAIYAPEAATEQLDFFRTIAPIDQNQATKSGITKYVADTLPAASAQCVAAFVSVITDGGKPSPLTLVLVPMPHDTAINPTPWVIRSALSGHAQTVRSLCA